ncbi:CaiB/BaiF CoA transferase family protein [Bosea sp. (in: a-proteobacteria)]|jgi:CoA:oxalate CoA-transferase|uniref:CaiB/BaiF CoA transferase family protein n=1 Tax=Bosea sp. (in: a-proteobacteria) TaxID=1871050 RepID=UPI003F6FA6FD
MSADAASPGPLSGIRVIDATHMLAGPYCTWLLGALGADVIKVERRGAGDFTRIIAPFRDQKSIYFMSVNRNKRSLTLDLKSPRGKAIFARLLKGADVFVENNRAGVMDRLGFGYGAAAELNPRLVYASISGFGQTGPYRNKPSFDAIAQALSGMMSITGEETGAPARVGASIGDIASSLFATIGVLSALQQRTRTGRGTFIDVAMLDCQLALMENAVARYLNAGEVPRRLGSRHPLIAPFQAFQTADEPIAVCVDTNEQWERLCGALARLDLLSDARFPDGSARAANHAELEPILAEIFRSRGRAAWLDALDEADVPASAINSVPEALADPQVVSRGMVTEIPAGSGHRFVGVPIQMPATPLPEEKAPPELGEHTDAILRDLGFSQPEIEALRAEAVI